MESVPVFVGLDYHSRSVQVCVLDGAGKVLRNRRCDNDTVAILGVIERGWAVRGAAVESCCGAADLGEGLRGAGWDLSLAHPGIASRMKLNPDKTDFGDARMLAELCRVGMVPRVWLAPLDIRELRLLVRLRFDLVSRARAIKTRILGVLRAQRVSGEPDVTRWTKGWVSWLTDNAMLSDAGRFVIATHLAEWKQIKARIAEVEAKMMERTSSDPVVATLREQKGIGPVTAWTMRALIGDFARFQTGKQLARFCAVTPRNASSGQRVADSGLIRAGDPLLKSVLVEAAHRLRRHDARWRAFSEQLLERGKPASVIVAAIANRWVRWLLHRMKEVQGRAAA